VTTVSQRAPTTETSRSWEGWLLFGGVLMALLGLFQAINGALALADPGYYAVGPHGLPVHVTFTVWGWTHLIVGAVALFAGVGLLYGNVVARFAGVAVCVVSAVVNLAFLAAAPFWSTLLIALDVLLIYAITVHGGELEQR
jgi:hypothetical protein